MKNAPPNDSELDVRAPWVAAPEAISPTHLDDWYLGPTFHVLPDKPTLAREGIGAVVAGWAPQKPIIGRSTRVIGLGSCFASYFLAWLAEHGFNRGLESSPHNALVRYGSSFESAAVIAQQFRWAFEGIDPSHLKWIGKDRQLFEASEERRALVRRTLEQADVLILTLGLSEVWYDAETGEPLWRAITRRHYDPARHVFRVETMQDTKRWLAKIESLRRAYLPRMKIVFTVSPVRLRATFRPVSAITADSASKAILRAALDEFLREQGEALGRDLHYFPSFEIVRDFFRDPFEEDNRHVARHVAERVIASFAESFCEAELGGARHPAHAAPADESAARIAELETRAAELQRACDERLRVIRDLESTARERLELIERLDAECASLRKRLSAG